MKRNPAWDRVLASRKKERPVGTEYIEDLFSDFTELHGDRYFGDDPAIVGGIARFHGMACDGDQAQEKGRNTRENVLRNFAMPSPEGYRKALRLMKQAEKFHRRSSVLSIHRVPSRYGSRGAWAGMKPLHAICLKCPVLRHRFVNRDR